MTVLIIPTHELIYTTSVTTSTNSHFKLISLSARVILLLVLIRDWYGLPARHQLVGHDGSETLLVHCERQLQ